MTITDTDNLDDTESADDQPDTDAPKRLTKQTRQISISVRGLVIGAVIAVLAVAVGVLTWLYIGAEDKLSAEARTAAERSQAETVATDYAVNAAQMDYQDFEAWKLKLVNGTSPELKEKLSTAADSMQEILAPLQWKSSALPLAAKVRSDTGGIYVVDAFVSVLTKTVQAPEGLQSTATYSVTLDGKNNWQITDVGGIDAALGK
ncbi:hypothetical protein [Mycolicibacterium parafortuitum]|uniref:Mce-associated membrane protein n=1 Tax=Mycolicibacterium parafortuitum TaxID=39692 RepID=A0A375YET5_MYCPF|nr:hypothetical protein [Mycolicibacterium parafortuitum]ORB30100.1 hypothetical protein BST38_11390 [Mycolicibacterium parafortuitum]SRX79600.1 hypothetical protein MPP7335_01337 [Mycolicibacterium parafortuitum]